MKIVYVLPSNLICGGHIVVLQHITRLQARGYDISICLLDRNTPASPESFEWFPYSHIPVFHPEAFPEDVDICVATFWATLIPVLNFPAQHKVYFVQSDETRFYDNPIYQSQVALTYFSNIHFMTEARWIVEWLNLNFGKSACYIPNGFDPTIIHRVDPIIPKPKDKYRILVEGSINTPFKRIKEALEVCSYFDCEVWCVSNQGKPCSDWKIDRFFYQVPFNEMKSIYSSCDILLKLSSVEGFFGPPLEMMACGGVCVVSDVTGYDEYIVNEYNALVVPNGEIELARKAIQRLIDDRDLYRQLQKNGQQTSQQMKWDTSINKLESFFLEIAQGSRLKSHTSAWIKQINQTLNAYLSLSQEIEMLRLKAQEVETLRSQVQALENSSGFQHSGNFNFNQSVFSVFKKTSNFFYQFSVLVLTKLFKLVYWIITFQFPQKLRRWRIAQIISKSGLFDTGYYWQQNPDVKLSNVDPLGHYLDIGASQGKDPNPLFDTSFYLEQYPEVTQLGMNPLAHYIMIGAKKGNKPHPLFDTTYYLEQYPDVVELGINPLLHYLTIGLEENRHPFPCSTIELPSFKLRAEPIVSEEIPKSLDPNYQTWLSFNYPTSEDLNTMAEQIQKLEYQPLISIIMPVFNPKIAYLKTAINSVLNQVYQNWQLCIADDASTNPQVYEILADYAAEDTRIKVVFRQENGHIAEASNSAFEIAMGEFIALLDHDDVLTPHALYHVVSMLNDHADADMIYSDEDKIDEQGYLSDPFFKPDWCPDSFLSKMYTCHLGVYRRSLVEQIGAFRVGYEGSQDYDLVLRLTEKTDKIFHIPNVLYHWRIHAQSTSTNIDSKNYAVMTAKKALSEAIERRGEPGTVTDVPYCLGNYHIRYELKTDDLVSIIIPTKDLGDTLNQCLKSIFEQSTYPNFEIILIDNGSTEERSLEVMKQWQEKEPEKLKVFPLKIPFNYSQINNFAVQHSQGKYLLFLNNDIEVITPDWIEALVEQAQRPSIGAVGALLLFPDDTIQHAGVIGGIFYSCGHSHKRFPFRSPGYFNQLNTITNYSAVTGACLMCRRDVFEEIGGFDETLAVNYNDIDLCFKMIDKGYRNIYLPHVVLYHYESKSRGYDSLNNFKKARLFCEGKYFQTQWKVLIEHDPCYNPNLTFDQEDYSIRT
ncbi:glycosyl transferase family 2 [Rippkaea orientalis PCC 8801]|uniref:Glycosyl transferase family 2 n=1 Tax=Rippkaea orientalis (strain PCC 8801 / RF-1) TaxID=41431 RepID=B7JZP0_RIPO1|nr:glycosyltransferase [Rippkaea orientalis]ACK64983.1 glycosyl transferase family 2 [Rippkaea orientalis PCC 8801]